MRFGHGNRSALAPREPQPGARERERGVVAPHLVGRSLAGRDVELVSLAGRGLLGGPVLHHNRRPPLSSVQRGFGGVHSGQRGTWG